MSKFEETREPLGEVHYPTEVPEDLEAQAEFFDKIQHSLSSRMREES